MTARPLPPDTGTARVVGDGRTAALLTPAAEVLWWCGPDPDSRPVLWSLLDPEGATARWREVLPVDASGPVAGPCQRTVVRCGLDRVECVDGFLLGRDDSPSLVRLVRAVDRPVTIEHEVAAGGFDAEPVRWSDELAGRLGETPVRVLSTGRSRVDDGRVRTTITAEPERWQVLVVALGEPPPLLPEVLHARLHAAATQAHDVVDPALLPQAGRDRLLDALHVLQACTWPRTGAVVASLTTSLPEAPGGDRQFDYRFTWLRDASLAVSVASLLGRTDVARPFLAFARGAVADDPLDTPPLVTVRGEPVPQEREVEGVQGWAGSRPVRVGNDARDQRQYDALGLLVEAVSVHVQTGGRLDADTWRTVVRVADAVADEVLSGAHPPSSGIWELRTPRRLVNDDIGRWLVLDRAVWIARMLRPWHRRGRWLRARDRVQARVLDVLGEDGSLPQSYDEQSPTPDASALGAAVFGLVPPDDPRAARLVDWLLDRLGAEDLVYRYPPGVAHQPAADGFCGREGTFLPMAFWAVAALAAVGQVERAEARLARLSVALPRLLSEEFDPVAARPLGNTPLLWSHMALARACYILQAAHLRRRYGAVGFGVWRVVRYVRLRSAADRS